MNDERRFPDIDAELRPTAERVADALRAEVPPEVAERHEALLRARLAGGDVRPIRSARRRTRRTLVTLAAAAVLVLALPIVAVASDRAVPGNLLYGVDRGVERLELVLATGSSDEVRVLLDQAAERLEELETLEEAGRSEAFDGLLQDLRDAEDRALETAGTNEGLTGTVLTAIDLHTQRLQDVRDRLDASGTASPYALDALDRAIEARPGATEASDRGRPDDAGPPEDRGRPEGRPDDAPGPTDGPPTQEPGRPDDAGPPDDGDQSPASPPAGPDEAPNGSANESGEDPGAEGREFGEQRPQGSGEQRPQGSGEQRPQGHGGGDGDQGGPESTTEPDGGGPPEEHPR